MNKIEQFYEPIGKMIIAFQYLDSTLSLIFMSLVKEDPNVTMSLIAGLSFSKRLDALRALSTFKMSPYLVNELADIIKRIGKCEDRRNTIVHSSWIGTLDGKTVFRDKPSTSRKKGLIGGIFKAEIAEISDVTKTIQESHSALLCFAKKLTSKGIIKIKIFENVN